MKPPFPEIVPDAVIRELLMSEPEPVSVPPVQVNVP